MLVTNISILSGFLLLGFSNSRQLLFSVMYLLDLAVNFIIITITMLDPKLQSPMYFFLKYLALLELSSLPVTVPQSIHNSLTGSGHISYAKDVLQVFFFVFLSCAEMAILTVMSYDHYVVICLPLHYEVILGPRICKWTMMALWISGGISGILYTAATFSIRFCRDKIICQFCDVPQLLKLSCSNNDCEVIGMVAFIIVMTFVCFIAIEISYAHIFSTVINRLNTPAKRHMLV